MEMKILQVTDSLAYSSGSGWFPHKDLCSDGGSLMHGYPHPSAAAFMALFASLFQYHSRGMGRQACGESGYVEPQSEIRTGLD